jgi:hypothetical protein
MGLEVCKGKVRPMLPRPSDVEPAEPRTDAERLEGRNADGTASSPNQIAVGRGWKSRIRRAVRAAAAATGTDITPRDEDLIQADADVVYMGILSAAPVTGPLVRINAASCALEFALAGYLHDQALKAGLLTELGERLESRASHHRQRVERLSVTVHAMSQQREPRKDTVKSMQKRILESGKKKGPTP